MRNKTRNETVLLAVLLLVAALVWWYARSSSSAAAETATSIVNYKPMGVENPRIHFDRVADARNTEYKSSGRDIFDHAIPAPPPPPVVRIPQPGDNDYVAPVPPPPPPPKLPLKYFGYGIVDGAKARRAFLTDGDTVFVVAEGEVLAAHFRLIKINNRSLEFEDLTTGRTGTAAIEDPGPSL